MSIDTTTPRSRRALLAGAFGGVLASLGLMSKPEAARAGVDGDLTLGVVNTSNAKTELQATTTSPGLKVVATDVALQGWGSIGVDGYGTTIGVNAISDGAGGPGVVAYNRADGVGVFGWTTDGNQSPPTMPAKRGVYGLSADGVGVNGASTDGIGVRGDSVNGPAVAGMGPFGIDPVPGYVNPGVFGSAANEPGVYGYSTFGYGVRGDATDLDGVYGVTNAAQAGPDPHPAHDPGAGVHGHGGLAGVLGTGDSSFGVMAQSNSVPAIYALNSSATAAAIVAEGEPGTAIHGHANAGGQNQVNIPNSPALTGIYGSATALGTAMAADSASGLALRATSSAGNAIRGHGQLDGVIGESGGDRAGLVGFSGAGSAPAGPAKTGVYGEATQDAAARGVTGKSTTGQGVRGEATSGVGVQGVASSGQAVRGDAGTGYAVYGTSSGGSAVRGSGQLDGVVGESPGGRSGVVGFSGGAAPAGQPKVGVYGEANQDTSARGVLGKSTVGQGVRGEATSGAGVVAVATTGVALAVSGRMTLSRSGKVNIAAGVASADVTVAGGLSSTAIAFATVQYLRTGVWVVGARPNWPSAGKLRIYLNKAPASSTPVAWMVLG